MYRETGVDAPSPGPLITVRTFLDPVEAELARVQLLASGIRAMVFEPTGFNPLLTAVAGGVQLQVAEGDAGRADAILRHTAVDTEEDDEPEDAVRCPRCELAYCFLERPTLRNSGASGIGFFAYVVGRFAKKRWCCHKCEHVWDDPHDGPRKMTKALPDDPRPVFRLRRSHGGMGLFLGASVAVPMGAAVGEAIVFVAPALAFLGWLAGRSVQRSVCSDPACRAPLAPGSEKCGRCHGAVAGSIDRATEHWVEAAAFRQELAAMRRQDDAARATRRKTKKRSRPRVADPT